MLQFKSRFGTVLMMTNQKPFGTFTRTSVQQFFFITETPTNTTATQRVIKSFHWYGIHKEHFLSLPFWYKIIFFSLLYFKQPTTSSTRLFYEVFLCLIVLSIRNTSLCSVHIYASKLACTILGPCLRRKININDTTYSHREKRSSRTYTKHTLYVYVHSLISLLPKTVSYHWLNKYNYASQPAKPARLVSADVALSSQNNLFYVIPVPG